MRIHLPFEVVVAQIKWERDVAISQLDEIGKSLGEKMDDVARIVRCKDCVYRCENDGITTCMKDYGIHHGDWFCADGRQK